MAYAAIRQYEMGAGSVSDFVRIVDQGLAQTLSGQPGFLGYYVIASGGDEVVSVSMFDDEDSAVRSNQLAAEFVRDRLQQFRRAVNAPVQACAAAPTQGERWPGQDAG